MLKIKLLNSIRFIFTFKTYKKFSWINLNNLTGQLIS